MASRFRRGIHSRASRACVVSTVACLLAALAPSTPAVAAGSGSWTDPLTTNFTNDNQTNAWWPSASVTSMSGRWIGGWLSGDWLFSQPTYTLSDVQSTPVQFNGQAYSSYYTFEATTTDTSVQGGYAALGTICSDGLVTGSASGWMLPLKYSQPPDPSTHYGRLSWCPAADGPPAGYYFVPYQMNDAGGGDLDPADAVFWRIGPTAGPHNGAGVNAGWATAPLGPIALELAKSGYSPLEVCETATEAPAAAHLQDTTTSDQTNECLDAISGPGSDAERISRGLEAMRATAAAAGVAVVGFVVYELLHTTGAHPQPNPGPNPNPNPGPLPSPGPSPLPPPMPGSTELQLVTRRIAVAEPRLDPTTVKTAARKCLDEEAAASDTSQPCLTLPLFFPGLDAKEAATHDAAVIANVPAWFKVTYMSPTDKKASGVNRDWYRAAAYRTQCPAGPAKRQATCDEYPFYSTVEGGPTAYALTTSVLEEISQTDNSKEGRALQEMQYDPNCQMAKSAGKATDFPGSSTQQFVIIPMVLPISTHLCANPTAE